MEYKSNVYEIKEVDGRVVTGFASIFGNIDSYGDRMVKGSFKKTINEGMDHIRHLWQHKFSDPPIATIKELTEVSRGQLTDSIKEKYPEATGGLLVSREYLDTPRGEEILQGITKGAIKEMSFGFDPIKFDFEEEKGSKPQLIRNLREVRLWDISDVNWGANPATVAAKSAVLFKDTGAVDEEWQAPTLEDFTTGVWDDLSEAEKSRIECHYAYAGQDAFDSIKFAHHKVIDGGVGPVVWKGVAACMTALIGVNDIPEEDRKGVYEHLSQHYKQFDKQPPDYKFVEAMSKTLALTEEEIASGIVGYFNSRAVGIESAFANLKELLLTAKPWEAEKSNPALTFVALQKLELIKNQIRTL